MENQTNQKCEGWNCAGEGHFCRKKWIVPVVAGLLSLFLLALTLKEFKSLPYVGRNMPAVNTISVSGKGEVVVKPDIATFSFSVNEEALVVGDAQERATKTVNEILASLKKLGVAENDLKTVNYNIYPRYEYMSGGKIDIYGNGKRVLAGYDVTQTIEVKVRKIGDAGKLIANIGELGASDISGLTFTVDEPDAVTEEARSKAITDAREKADRLAKDLGVKIVRIVSFSEGGNYPIYYSMKAELSVDGRGGAVPPSPELPAGENKITSNVTITYEIR